MTSIKGMFGYGKKLTAEEEEEQRQSQVILKEKLEKEVILVLREHKGYREKLEKGDIQVLRDYREKGVILAFRG
jgi:hypothetical protein